MRAILYPGRLGGEKVRLVSTNSIYYGRLPAAHRELVSRASGATSGYKGYLYIAPAIVSVKEDESQT
jgi:hypothetical protein